jgi:hypothetical protein
LTALRAFEDGYRYVFLEAPTGFGKSPISMALAKYFGQAYILASKKFPQAQYMKHFPVTRAKGRENFRSLLDPARKANLADCKLRGSKCLYRPTARSDGPGLLNRQKGAPGHQERRHDVQLLGPEMRIHE